MPVRVSVREAQRTPLPALDDPVEGDVSVHRAMRDADPGKIAQRLQVRTPQLVLERRFRHGRDTRAQQRLQDAEEDRQCPHCELVTRCRDEARRGMDHPFLDLVPADRRASHRASDLVREGGLTRAGRAAYDDERGRGSHLGERLAWWYVHAQTPR
jgi:hypothetical protein